MALRWLNLSFFVLVQRGTGLDVAQDCISLCPFGHPLYPAIFVLDLKSAMWIGCSVTFNIGTDLLCNNPRRPASSRSAPNQDLDTDTVSTLGGARGWSQCGARSTMGGGRGGKPLGHTSLGWKALQKIKQSHVFGPPAYRNTHLLTAYCQK